MTAVLLFNYPDIKNEEVQEWLENNKDVIKVIEYPAMCRHVIACYDEAAATEFKLKFSPRK
jgi:hypothetical protein